MAPLEDCHQFAECVQLWLNYMRFGHSPFKRFDGLQSVTGDADNNPLISTDTSGFDQLFAAASVTPPAVSVKMPSVAARSLIASTISSSLACSPCPPELRTVSAA